MLGFAFVSSLNNAHTNGNLTKILVLRRLVELVWRLSLLALRIFYNSKYGNTAQGGARLCVTPADCSTLRDLGPTHYRLARALNIMERRQFLEVASEGARHQKEWANLADEIVQEFR